MSSSSPAPNPQSSATTNGQLLNGIAAKGRRWLFFYHFGAITQTTFGFCLIYFRAPLGIPDALVPAVALASVALWLLYSIWLARLIMHSFSKAFWFVGLVSEPPQSSWVQITPSWLAEYERFMEANANSLLLHAALRGALIYIHQVPNHLQALQSTLNIARHGDAALPPATRHALDAADDELQRLTQFITTLRAFVDRNPASADVFDLWSTVCLLASRHPDAALLKLDPSSPRPLLARGCEPVVRQVLANVLNNALQYGDQRVFITSREIPASEHVEITVYDGGADLTKEEEHLAFRVNPRLVATGPHLGLGLPLSRHLLRYQGGDLQFVPSATRGCGKGVTISLPRGRPTQSR